MCYHAEFGRCALKREGTNTGEPTTLGALKFHSLEMGGVDDPQIHAPPPEDCSVTTSNLVVLLQRCLRRIDRRIVWHRITVVSQVKR